MDKVAVAILNYNGVDYLKQFLPSFVEHSSGASIYLIDNQSTDDSIAFVRSAFPQVKIIQLSSNLGYAGGYNEGLRQIACEYVAIVNSDIQVTPKWLSPLLSFLENNPQCVAVQPKIKSFDQQDHFEYAGASGGFIDAFGYPFCRGRIFELTEKDSGQYDDTTEVFWTSGACFLIRKQAYENHGGFDQDFFAHMEEIDLCWRLKRAGGALHCLPECEVYHVGGGTLSSVSPKKTFLNFRNSLSLLVKNLTAGQIIVILPMRILLDWIALVKFTLEGSPNHASAVLKAHADFFWNIRRDLSKRSGDYTANSMKPRITRSIVWRRFITGVKKFSELRSIVPK